MNPSAIDIFKVLLEVEACEWQNSGEGNEIPKKVIQVLTKMFPYSALKAINSHLKLSIWVKAEIQK